MPTLTVRVGQKLSKNLFQVKFFVEAMAKCILCLDELTATTPGVWPDQYRVASCLPASRRPRRHAHRRVSWHPNSLLSPTTTRRTPDDAVHLQIYRQVDQEKEVPTTSLLQGLPYGLAHADELESGRQLSHLQTGKQGAWW
jgi:hypothetical protein